MRQLQLRRPDAVRLEVLLGRHVTRVELVDREGWMAHRGSKRLRASCREEATGERSAPACGGGQLVR